jgi:orotidine-5'-phosphate decarboxylase
MDMTDALQVASLAERLAPHVAGVKFGLEFFNAHGRSGVAQIAGSGVPIFLDLKLHDIPNTVDKAIRSLAGLSPALLTIHASGGAAMIARAVTAAREALGEKTRVIAVTVLTSLDEADLNSVGIEATPLDQAVRLAKLAKASGAAGVVCSPQEITAIRAACGGDFMLVVPGIRPAGSDTHDQKRSMTPEAALQAGADYLVIGRPITEAADPVAVVEAMFAK